MGGRAAQLGFGLGLVHACVLAAEGEEFAWRAALHYLPLVEDVYPVGVAY